MKIKSGPVSVYVQPLDGDGMPQGHAVELAVTTVDWDGETLYGAAPVNRRWMNFSAWRAKRRAVRTLSGRI